MTGKIRKVLGFVALFISNCVLAQSHPHLSLMSHLDASALSGSAKTSFSSLWGYAAPDGREYAIIGSRDSVYFVNVTDPHKPVICGRFAGKASSCTNREFKTYSHYCYAVSDVCSNYGSLQIYDLQYLPDSVHKVADNDSICIASHTLYIENDRLYLNSRTYLKKSVPDLVPMSVYSLQDPLHPALLADIHSPIFGGSAAFNTVHDMHALHDTVYLCCLESGLYICDLRNPKVPNWLGGLSGYPDAGYNHSCWVTEDSRRLVFTDENNGLAVKLYDLANLHTQDQQSIERISEFGSHTSQGSIAHNPYFKGNLIWMSYYQDGVVVFDWSDEHNVKEIGSYDTYPQNDTAANKYVSFQGCWNVYPYLPSGNVIASDITNGLFVVRLDTVSALDEIQESHLDVKIINNPCQDVLSLDINIPITANTHIEIFNTLGRRVLVSNAPIAPGGQILSLNAASFKPGFYILKCAAGNKRESLRFIKQ
jgi:choice-of-anchor B domain-containing protein